MLAAAQTPMARIEVHQPSIGGNHMAFGPEQKRALAHELLAQDLNRMSFLDGIADLAAGLLATDELPVLVHGTTVDQGPGYGLLLSRRPAGEAASSFPPSTGRHRDAELAIGRALVDGPRAM